MVQLLQRSLVLHINFFFSNAARFLGPGFNQFQNYNNENEEDSNTSDEGDSEEHPTSQQKSEADDEEGWGDWKNAEEFRRRFNRKLPGRIIHLGDGTELFTDKHSELHDEDAHMSDSSEEDSEDDDPKKMQFDEHLSDHHESSHPKEEIRYQSPLPAFETPASHSASEN